MWERIRESQRQSSIALSRELVERGSCARAIESLERAQAARELGAYAAESTWLKARCLAALGRSEEALAHWRLLRDYYADSRFAERIPEPALPRLGAPEPLRARPAPEAFEIPKPRFSSGARRADVTGPVWVEYRLDAEGRPEEIRVIGAAHPLLASYAVEAVAAGRWRRSAGANVALPRRAATSFRFESPWSREADGDDAEGGSGTGIEWFPQSGIPAGDSGKMFSHGPLRVP